jgi:hypothetical protein
MALVYMNAAFADAFMGFLVLGYQQRPRRRINGSNPSTLAYASIAITCQKMAARLSAFMAGNQSKKEEK